LLISGFDLVLSELAPGLFGQDRLKFVRIGVQGSTHIDRGPFGGSDEKGLDSRLDLDIFRAAQPFLARILA